MFKFFCTFSTFFQPWVLLKVVRAVQSIPEGAHHGVTATSVVIPTPVAHLIPVHVTLAGNFDYFVCFHHYFDSS